MKVHTKAIISVMLIISCLSGMFLYLFYTGSKQSYDRSIHFLATQLEQGIQSKTNAIQVEYLTRLEGLISTSPNIIKAFKERNRKLLYELTLPKFNVLKKNINSLFGFTYILPDATILLRMQKPDFFGDSVAHVPFAQHLLKNNKTSIGFAITKIGALFRIVVPVYEDGTYIGAIGWALKASLLAEHIQKSQNIIYGVFADGNRFKKFVAQDVDAVAIKEHVLIESNESTNIFSELPVIFDPHVTIQNVTIDNKTFLIYAEQLKNFSGQHVGAILLTTEITEETVLFQKQIRNAIAVTLIVLLLSFVILHFSFGKLIGKIEKLNKSLEKRVEERTKKLTKALDEINTLEGILPLCSYCKKIRNDKDEWENVDVYIHTHSDANISHGVCPECALKHYPKEYAAIMQSKQSGD